MLLVCSVSKTYTNVCTLYQTQKVRLTLSNSLSLLDVVLAQVFRVTLIFENGIAYYYK